MSSASEPNILELSNVSYSYRKQDPLISSISLSVGQGEFIGLLGANGSGKSTILKLGSGILRPHAGEVLLWSKPLHTYRNRDRAKLISYLPQTLDITVPFTVRELVAMGLYPYDIPPAMSIDSALEIVGLLDKASGTPYGPERRGAAADVHCNDPCAGRRAPHAGRAAGKP